MAKRFKPKLVRWVPTAYDPISKRRVPLTDHFKFRWQVQKFLKKYRIASIRAGFSKHKIVKKLI